MEESKVEVGEVRWLQWGGKATTASFEVRPVEKERGSHSGRRGVAWWEGEWAVTGFKE
jgi:hypothetical protein